MKIISHSDIDRSAWRELVRESRTGSWFQLPEAYEFFAQQPSLFKPFVVAIEDCKLRGVCVGYVTKEKNAIRQFFTRRAIIIGGPCLADDCTDEEVVALMAAVRENLQAQAIYIESRNFNDYSRWKSAFEKAGFDYQEHLNFHVNCSDAEQLWERLSDNRKRQIRKAESLVVAELAADEKEIREWYKVLEKLYQTKVKTPLWPVEFFVEAFRQGVGMFMLVKSDGQVIGGSMLAVLEGRCVYEWFECGLNAAFREQYPSVMATYSGMKFAADAHIPKYDMMGAGKPGVPYGVRDFKSEFGGELVEHGRYLSVCKPCLYKLGALGVRMLKRE